MNTIYLYVKRCKHCGLKYFGKTIKQNLTRYKGSGKYWMRHIAVHGQNNVETIDSWKFDSQAAATEFALNFSKENCIVESQEWANLIPEDGKDGNSAAVITPELRIKFQLANRGENNPQYGTRWINNGTTNKKIKAGETVPVGWTYGRHFTEAHQQNFTKRSKVGRNNPGYNHTLYTFYNTHTHETVTCTFNDFCLMYKINPRGVRKLTRKEITIFKNWQIT